MTDRNPTWQEVLEGSMTRRRVEGFSAGRNGTIAAAERIAKRMQQQGVLQELSASDAVLELLSELRMTAPCEGDSTTTREEEAR